MKLKDQAASRVANVQVLINIMLNVTKPFISMLYYCALYNVETSTSYLAGCVTVCCMLSFIPPLENGGWCNILNLKLKFATFKSKHQQE